MIAEATTEAPPLQPAEARDVPDGEIIQWLNEHLAIYARENRSLRESLAEKDRQIEIYRRLIADFDRQKVAAT